MRTALAPGLERGTQLLETHQHGGRRLRVRRDATGQHGRAHLRVTDRHIDDLPPLRIGPDGNAQLAADAEILRHHAPHELERVRCQRRNRAHRHLGEDFIEDLAQDRIRARHDELFVHQFRDAHRPPFRQRMASVDADTGVKIQRYHELDTLAPLHRVPNRDVYIAPQQRRLELIRIGDRNLEFDVRIPIRESLEKAREKVARNGFVQADAHRAGVIVFEAFDLGTRKCQLIHRVLDAEQQRLPCRGQSQALAAAYEQRRADFLLEDLNLPGDRRSGDMDLLRCQPERAVARHFVKVTKCSGVREIWREPERHSEVGDRAC